MPSGGDLSGHGVVFENVHSLPLTHMFSLGSTYDNWREVPDLRGAQKVCEKFVCSSSWVSRYVAQVKSRLKLG